MKDSFKKSIKINVSTSINVSLTWENINVYLPNEKKKFWSKSEPESTIKHIIKNG
jgi:hypothetical protein